jgi:hypothetical protein
MDKILEDIVNNHFKIKFEMYYFTNTFNNEDDIRVIYYFDDKYKGVLDSSKEIYDLVNNALDELHDFIFNYAINIDQLVQFPFEKKYFKNKVKIIKNAMKNYELKNNIKFKEYLKFKLGIKKYSRYEHIDLMKRLSK